MENKIDSRPNSSDSTEIRRRRFMGFVFIAVSGYLAFRFYTMNTPFSRRLLLLIVIVLFLLAGIQLVTDIKGRLLSLMVGVIFVGFSILGFFAAFSGEIHGGIPFFPAAWNQAFGKALFAFGDCITAAMALWCIYQAVKPNTKR
ncbi:MAG: hypothetical protein ABSG97_03110 [Sedimentisphaerales bacterium]|jgi:hypothetical protein